MVVTLAQHSPCLSASHRMAAVFSRHSPAVTLSAMALLALQQRTSSTRATASNGVLLRQFLHDSLYHKTDGYFAKQPPVGSLARPFDWQAMRGQRGTAKRIHALYDEERCSDHITLRVPCADYQAAVSQRYRELKVAWLTPAEIFSPVYGASMAAFIREQHRLRMRGEPLRIVEIGGGTGTLAADILVGMQTSPPSCLAAFGLQRLTRVADYTGQDEGR